MQSKTSFSNLTLFKRCLSRYWPLWVIIFAIMTFLGPVALGSTLSYLESQHIPAKELLEASGNNVYDTLRMMPAYTAVAGILAAVASFDFLFSTKLTGLMSSIPTRRRGVFVQHYLAGAVMLLSSLLVTAIAILIVQAAHHAVTFSIVLEVFAVSALECLIFYSIAVFCCSLTGHFLVAIALYGLVNLAAGILWALLSWFIATYVFGVSSLSGGKWLLWFSPALQLMSNSDITETGFTGWPWVWIYTVAAAILTVLACVLFQKRHMERAQDTVAFPKLRPVLKYIVTFYAAMGLPLLVSSVADVSDVHLSLPAHLLLTVISAVIGYFISEMIIQKSIHVFQKKHWIGIAASALACCLVVCGLRLDWPGIGHRIPDPEQVDAVMMQAGDNFYVDSEEGIEAVENLHRSILDAFDNGVIQEMDERESAYITLNYLLKNGEVEARQYAFAYDADFAKTVEDALNSEPLRSENVQINPPLPVDADHIADAWINWRDEGSESDEWQQMHLTAADMADLYENGIRPDCMHDAFGQTGLHFDKALAEKQYEVTIEISLYEPSNEPTTSSWYVSYTPNTDTENTNNWLTAHGINLTPGFAPEA